MEKNSASGSEKKIQEYVNRIKNGESKDSIMEGLPPSFVSGIEAGLNNFDKNFENKKNEIGNESGEPKIPAQYEGLDSETLEFIWTIPEYIDSAKTKKEKERKQKVIDNLKLKENSDKKIKENKIIDEIKIEEVRKDLGIGSDENISQKERELETLQKNESEKNKPISALIKYVSLGRKQVVLDLYKNLFEQIDDENSRSKLISALINDVYSKYRVAEYKNNLDEEKIWEDAIKNNRVPVDNRKSEWMYRGNFPQNGQETVTRASFNVNVSPMLIDQIDELIISGKIKANYKFGQPGTSASPTERHDAITMYFLEQPSDDVLKELSKIIKPHARGDNLLGKKIDDGFYMSEIGSVESSHIDLFIDQLKSKDPAFAEAVKGYTSPRPGEGKSLKMSEAQFYAVKDVAKAFGYNISYDKSGGFGVK